MRITHQFGILYGQITDSDLPPRFLVTFIFNFKLKLNKVEAKLNKLKNRKSPGTNHIPNELLTYGGPELARKQSQLFNKILNKTKTPEEWYNSITILILKKGRKTYPQSCGGITLLNSTMKLFMSILEVKLETSQEYRRTTGFHRGKINMMQYS